MKKSFAYEIFRGLVFKWLLPDKKDPSIWTRRLVFRAVPVVSFIGIFVILFGGTRILSYPETFLYSLKYSALIFGAYFVISCIYFRRRIVTFIELLAALLVALFTVPACCLSVVCTLNVLLDDNQPRSHRLQVVERTKEIANTAKTTSIDYVLLVPSWRLGADYERVSVSEEEYEQVTPRQTEVTLRTRAGRFGFEWLDSYKIHFRNDS